MTKKATLLRRIDAFLQTRKRSSGGYADVDPQEMDALHDILQRLLELKYERDPDGDLPVEVDLVDRTRYERPLRTAVPYAHKPQEGKSELELHLQAADRYGDLAKWASDAAQRHMQSVSSLLQETVAAERALTFRGVRYLPRPPAGVTPVEVQNCLNALVATACKRNPCPVDLSARQAWQRKIAEEASRELKLRVLAISCVHTSTGVRAFFEAPGLDASFRVEPGASADD